MGGDYGKVVTKAEDVRAKITAEVITSSLMGLVTAAIEVAHHPTTTNVRVLRNWVNDAIGDEIFPMDDEAPPDVVSPG